MALKLEDKQPKVKTSVDIDYKLLSKAQRKMKRKGHTLRMIVESALTEYTQDEPEEEISKK